MTTGTSEDVADHGRPRLLVYRKFLLPLSETFVLQQAVTLQRYRPTLVGLRRVDGLDLEDVDHVVARPGGAGPLGEVGVRMGRPPGAFIAQLRARRPAAIHAHFGQDALQAIPLKHRLGVPLIVTLHGYDITKRATPSNGVTHLAYRARLPHLVRHADLVVAVSDHVRRAALAAGFPAERVVTHHIGVDVERFAPQGLDGRGPTVLAVGRFVEKKGFGDLIAAMAEVQRTRPEAVLRLVGAGPLDGELRQEADRLRVRVEFLGGVPSAEVARLMGAARILVVPSVTAASGDTEGLPITLLEGMASGMPVVGTRHAGIPEAVVDGVTGDLVDERDPRALAARIGAYLDDDDRWRSAAVAARARVEEGFDLRRQTTALEALYDRARGL